MDPNCYRFPPLSPTDPSSYYGRVLPRPGVNARYGGLTIPRLRITESESSVAPNVPAPPEPDQTQLAQQEEEDDGMDVECEVVEAAAGTAKFDQVRFVYRC
ncbi:hypothetical protein L227DRAFT_578916, partial [Lentinus tigrinus ALCF2SS1-6]